MKIVRIVKTTCREAKGFSEQAAQGDTDSTSEEASILEEKFTELEGRSWPPPATNTPLLKKQENGEDAVRKTGLWGGNGETKWPRYCTACCAIHCTTGCTITHAAESEMSVILQKFAENAKGYYRKVDEILRSERSKSM